MSRITRTIPTRVTAALAIALLMVGLFSGCKTAHEANGQLASSVACVVGEVRYRRASETNWHRLNNKSALPTGATILTAPGSNNAAVIVLGKVLQATKSLEPPVEKLPFANRLLLWGNSELTLDRVATNEPGYKASEATRLSLHKGAVVGNFQRNLILYAISGSKVQSAASEDLRYADSEPRCEIRCTNSSVNIVQPGVYLIEATGEFKRLEKSREPTAEDIKIARRFKRMLPREFYDAALRKDSLSTDSPPRAMLQFMAPSPGYFGAPMEFLWPLRVPKRPF